VTRERVETELTGVRFDATRPSRRNAAELTQRGCTGRRDMTPTSIVTTHGSAFGNEEVGPEVSIRYK
jgi:hypothetical protein